MKTKKKKKKKVDIKGKKTKWPRKRVNSHSLRLYRNDNLKLRLPLCR